MNHLLNKIDKNIGTLFILPTFLAFLVIQGFPIISTIFLSLTDAHLIYPGAPFIGLTNYAKLIAQPELWLSLLNACLLTAGSLVLQVIVGVAGAIALSQITRGRSLFRTLLIIPWAFPPIITVSIWKWLLDPNSGLVNYLLLKSGLCEAPLEWFSSGKLAIWSLIWIFVWSGYPFIMVAVHAAMQAIPEDFYDVARTEGASFWQEVRHVTLPAIKPVLSIMIVLRTIWIFNNFNMIYTATGGGPGISTQTPAIMAYNTAWKRFYIGEASAICTIMLVFLCILMFIYFRLQASRKGEDG